MTAKLFNLLDAVTHDIPSDCYHFVKVDLFTYFEHLPHGRYFVIDVTPAVSSYLAPLFHRKVIPAHYLTFAYDSNVATTSYWFKL